MTWTPDQLESERRYRFDERIGILCDGRKPTLDQLAIAIAEANEAIERIQQENRNAPVRNPKT